ncbi:hypothetical protein RJT34_23301 [Clitoria ternatea]|uniref:Uncharacterized protein n=1 Tax=Clitoria ternatea TaxID=43366 RepID=A0AAN9IIA5_CLITE
MSNNGTNNPHQEQQGVPANIRFPTPNHSLGGTSGLGFNDVNLNTMHPNASMTPRPQSVFAGNHVNYGALQQQQQGTSATIPPQMYHAFVAAALDAAYQQALIPDPNLFNPDQFNPQIRNMDMGSNYRGSFPHTPSPGAQGDVTSFNNGNYYTPTPNYAGYTPGESSSSIPRHIQTPIGALIGEATPSIQTSQWINNQNLPNSFSHLLSTGQSASPEMIQPRGSNMYFAGGSSSNNETRPQTLHELISAFGNTQPQAMLEAGGLPNPTSQGSGNPQPPRQGIPNSLYDPKYEQMGLPIDPILRAFELEKRRRDGDTA